jgi:aminopeptidase N
MLAPRAFPSPLARALVVGTITQLLLLAELAPREARDRDQHRSATERNPAWSSRSLSIGSLVADRWAPPAESPASRRLADAALVLSRDPEHRQPALRTLAASASTDEHWAALEEQRREPRPRPRVAHGHPTRRARAAG